MNTLESIKAIVFDWGDTLMRDFPEYQGAMVHWPRVEVIPGVSEALSQLHERITCCVASNAGDSDAELMGLALARVGIRQYFHHLVTSRELGATKPDPAFFREVLQRLGIEPQACIMIGNDYLKDIAPAKSVGLHTIWFSEAPVAEPAPCADAVIHSMKDLVAAVMKLKDKRQSSV
jgi:HAD superfamily hydrolase (TIGR01509 family)